MLLLLLLVPQNKRFDDKRGFINCHTFAMAMLTALDTTSMPWVLPPSSLADSLLSWTTFAGTQSGALSAPWVMILIRPWLPPLGCVLCCNFLLLASTALTG